MSATIRLPGLAIPDLAPLSTPLDGEESFELTIATRQDGGGAVVDKTFRVKLKTMLDLYAARTNNPNNVTAAQVGTYSTGQLDGFLADKLGKTEQAADSAKLAGQTHTQIIDTARSGLLLLTQYENDLDELTDAFNDATVIINTP